jgi:hypothetical protein
VKPEEEAAEKQKAFIEKLEKMFAASNMGEWTQEKAWADLDDHVAKGTSQEELNRLRPYHSSSWRPVVKSKAPQVGDAAPDGAVVSMAGAEVTLLGEVGDAPTILCFGSVTCPPFRVQFLKQVTGIAAEYGRVKLMIVYVKEAHPTDGWTIGVNSMDGTARADAKSLEERTAAARKLLELNPANSEAQVLLDSMDNTLVSAYEAMSSRLYVIHKQQVVYQGKVGPYELSPASLRSFLAGWKEAK